MFTLYFYNDFFSAPTVSVQISGGATPTAGESYQLTCNVNVSGNLNPTITYRWTRDAGTPTEFMSNSNTYHFNQLRLIDAANYVCIESAYLTDNIVAMSTNTQAVRIASEW